MKLALLFFALLTPPRFASGADISTFSFAGCSFPDTGQTAEYTAGDDGTYQWSGSAPRYTIYNGSDWGGTATSSVTVDNVTGLMWVSNMADAGYAYTATSALTQALSTCEGLNYAGYTDWRLPNVFELMSIANYGTVPALSPVYFPNTPNTCCWTSTRNHLPATYLYNWKFNAYDGSVFGYALINAKYSVRCVRGGW